MFSLYLCKKCSSSYAVDALDPHGHLLKKSMRCPNVDVCGGRIRIYAKTNVKVENATKVKALELYQATVGIGLPTERKCGPKDIRKLLVGSRVRDLKLEPSPDSRRSIIYSLTLDNGKVVHFATSTRGATIYKVTETKNGR